MPRIPKSNFNTMNPNARVGQVRTPGVSGTDRLIDATANVTRAIGGLMDQQSRAEAISESNEAKSRYESGKAQFLEALENADHKGNYNYPDPVNQGKMVSGNIGDLYTNLKKDYESTRTNFKNLTRSDVAINNLDDSVGDDLVKLYFQSRKLQAKRSRAHVNRTSLQSLELEHISLLRKIQNGQVATLPTDIKALEAKTNRLKSRVAKINGAEGMRMFNDSVDEIASKYTQKIYELSDGESADIYSQYFQDRIANEKIKKVAKFNSQNKKQQVSRRNELANRETLRAIEKTVKDSEYLTDNQIASIKLDISKMKNRPIFDDYRTIPKEETLAQVTNLVADIQLTKFWQDNYQKSYTSIIDADMNPNDIVDTMEAEDEILGSVEAKIASEDLKTVGLEIDSNQFRDVLKKKLVTSYNSFRNPDKLATIVENRHPGLDPAAKNSLLIELHSIHSMGDATIASKEERKQFQAQLEEWENDPQGAAKMSAFAAAQGKNTMWKMHSLTKDDPKKSYVVAASLAPEGLQAKMLENAALYKQNALDAKTVVGNIKGNVQNGLRSAIKNSDIEVLSGGSRNPLVNSIKQGLVHQGAAFLAAGEADSYTDAIDKAWEVFSPHFYAIRSGDDKSLIVGTTTGLGADLNNQTRLLRKGMDDALGLPDMTESEHRDFYDDLLGRPRGTSRQEGLRKEELSDLTKNYLMLRPDPKEEGKVRLKDSRSGLDIHINNETKEYDVFDLFQSVQKPELWANKSVLFGTDSVITVDLRGPLRELDKSNRQLTEKAMQRRKELIDAANLSEQQQIDRIIKGE